MWQFSLLRLELCWLRSSEICNFHFFQHFPNQIFLCIAIRHCPKLASLIFRVIFFLVLWFFANFFFFFCRHTCNKEFVCTLWQLFKFSSLHETWFSYHKNTLFFFPPNLLQFRWIAMACLEFQSFCFRISVTLFIHLVYFFRKKKHIFAEKFCSLPLLEINAIKRALSILFFLSHYLCKDENHFFFSLYSFEYVLIWSPQSFAQPQLQLKLLKHKKKEKNKNNEKKNQRMQCKINMSSLFVNRRAPTNNGQPLLWWLLLLFCFTSPLMRLLLGLFLHKCLKMV